MMTVGLDIGGANIKAADVTGRAFSRPFAIWKYPERLADELISVLNQFPAADEIAVTMTAELADCFTTKSEGVQHILESLEKSLRQSRRAGADRLRVWSTDGRFVSTEDARTSPAKVAAANWHALATWCGDFVPRGSSLLIDIGTTTTDIIPLVEGRPTPIGLTDLHRLQSGELSYSGVKRTPLCAIAHSVPFQQGYCSLAAELFATTLDVYLLLGQIAENDQDTETANGKPATRSAAWDRIARMICCDRDEVSLSEATQIARFLADVQRQRLAGSLDRVLQRLPTRCESVVVSGSGTFLARQLINDHRHLKDAEVIPLADKCSESIAEAACAFALAQLVSRK